MKVNYLKNPNKLNVILSPFYKKENLIIFMGAGSISKYAYRLIKENNVRKNIKNIR